MADLRHTDADGLVEQLIALRDTHDEDAGDVTIYVQDDMPLVTVGQRNVMIGIGSTIREALADAIANVTAGENPHDPMGRMEHDPPPLSDTECWACGHDSEEVSDV